MFTQGFSILLRHIFLLALLLQVSPLHVLPTLDINSVLKKHNKLIATVQSEKYIQKQIELGKQLTEKYMTPDFLEKVLDPEKTRIKQQRIFNETLLYQPSLNEYTLPFGLYNKDIITAGHLGIAWALEWGLYQCVLDHATDLYLEHLTQQATNISAFIAGKTNQSQQQKDALSMFFPPILNKNYGFYILSKEIVGSIFVYSLLSVLLHRSKKYFLLDQSLGPKNPRPVSQLIDPEIMKILTHVTNPHSWTTLINNGFKKLSWLPQWSEHIVWEVGKETVIMLIWIRSAHEHVIKEAWLKYLEKHSQAFEELINHLHENHKNAKLHVKRFIKRGLDPSFPNWFMLKIVHTSFWHTIFNIGIAIPAWIKAGKWCWNMYKQINRKQVTGDPELVSGSRN